MAMIFANKFSSKKQYIILSAVGKLLKSTPEILLFYFLASEVYSNFSVLYNQTLIISNWVLFGFGSAGYGFFGQSQSQVRLRAALRFVANNTLLIIAGYYLLNFVIDIPFSIWSILCGGLLAALAAQSLYLRCTGDLNKSVVNIDITPNLTMLLIFGTFILINVDPDVSMIVLFSYLIGFALSILATSKQNAGSHSECIPTSSIYRISEPFFALSAINIFLSKIDSTLLQGSVSADSLSQYILSTRIAALILTASYVFQGYYLPGIVSATVNRDRKELKSILFKYIADTSQINFIFSLICAILANFDTPGFFWNQIDVKTFFITVFLMSFISPLSVATYILVRASKTYFSMAYTIVFGFGSLYFIVNNSTSLQLYSVAGILYGSILLIKISESLTVIYTMRSWRSKSQNISVG